MQAPAAVAHELAELIEGCQRGERPCFHRLFEAYRPRVYSTARRMLGSDAAAKDLTQQVFLKLWDKIAQFRPDGDFSSWLYRVTVNACLNERRRWFLFVHREPPETPTTGGQEDAVLAGQVDAALGRVSPKLRAVLVLRHMEGLSYDEIAEVLGCTVGTVASRLSRAQAALAKAFNREQVR